MKFKIVSSLLAFTATFIFSTLILSPIVSKAKRTVFNPNSDAEVQSRISNFLQQDLENKRAKANKLMNRENDSDPMTFVAPVVEYAAKTEAMNLSGLPEDFQLSWLRYAHATSDSAYLVSHLKSLPAQATLNEEEKQMADIKFAAEETSRRNLLSVAEDYGVEIKD
jgi:hypothetical protein